MDSRAPPSTRYLSFVDVSVTCSRKESSFWPATLFTDVNGWPALLTIDAATTSCSPLRT